MKFYENSIERHMRKFFLVDSTDKTADSETQESYSTFQIRFMRGFSYPYVDSRRTACVRISLVQRAAARYISDSYGFRHILQYHHRATIDEDQ
jgi:hypothetical protein